MAPENFSASIIANGEDAQDQVNDELFADNLDAGAGNEPLLGASIPNALIGSVGNDSPNRLGSNNDSLDGGADNDTLCGGVRNDSLVAGPRNDRPKRKAGNDTLHGDADNDVYATASPANDTLLSARTKTLL